MTTILQKTYIILDRLYFAVGITAIMTGTNNKELSLIALGIMLIVTGVLLNIKGKGEE